MIKELRKKLDITIGELSFVLDVDAKQVVEWEKVDEVPPKIAKILKKRYSSFFSNNNTNNISNSINNSEMRKKKVPNNKLDMLFRAQSEKENKENILKNRKKSNKKIILKKKKNSVASNSNGNFVAKKVKIVRNSTDKIENVKKENDASADDNVKKKVKKMLL